MQEGVTITLFDKFEIRKNGEVLLDKLGNTRKTKLFLCYLILNKNRSVSHKELFELLWSGEEYANPGTALRTLLYRYRALVELEKVTELYDSIKSSRGCYQWNQELNISIDIYDFESYSMIGLNETMSLEKRRECLTEAISLYKADLLPESASEHWVVAKAAHYRELYIKDVLAYITILKSEGSKKQALELCTRARETIGYNTLLEFEETLLTDGQQSEKTVQYERMMAFTKQNERDIEAAKKILEVKDNVDTAFVCDFDMLKEIYHLQSRLLERTGSTMFLTILSLGSNQEKELPTLKNEKVISAMLECLKKELRCGDTICRYSDNQIIVMFPADSYEDAQKIIERIKHSYLKSYTREDCMVVYQIKPLRNAKE